MQSGKTANCEIETSCPAFNSSRSRGIWQTKNHRPYDEGGGIGGGEQN
jgi:hypothetical protein